MRRKILLPTDFSENAWSAILYAINLYSKEECTFYLLNAWTFINSGSRTYITSSYIDDLKEQSVQNLYALKEKVQNKSNNPNHKFETIFSENDFFDCVDVAAKKYDVDLIIMGTKGVSGIGQILFGSNTVKLMNEIKTCPILAVPENYKFISPEHIAFPTDYTRNYGTELSYLKDFAKFHGSEIKVVHINLKKNLTALQNKNLASLKENLSELPNSFHWIEELGNKRNTIKNFINEYGIDLLAMINYKHSFLENIVKEPIIKKLGYKARVPFFVIPNLD